MKLSCFSESLLIKMGSNLKCPKCKEQIAQSKRILATNEKAKARNEESNLNQKTIIKVLSNKGLIEAFEEELYNQAIS